MSKRKPKLTDRQRILIREALIYAIADDGGKFYRLGGHGYVPLRYDYRSYQTLYEMGYVERRVNHWKATRLGAEAIGEEWVQ